MDPSFEMDFTNLERLPTTTGIPLIDRLNTELNAQSDRLEDIFIEIACTNIDNPRKCAFYKELKNDKTVYAGVSDEDKQEIYELHRTGTFSKTELQELYGLNRRQLNDALGDKMNRLGDSSGFFSLSIDVQDELYQRNTDTIEVDDDFDANDADYLAIQEEVNNNPRD
jgi:hypothetical protein